jgi:hypothetical protein
MQQIFVMQYRINDTTFQINIRARDWHEAEAILTAIKETGFLVGTICTSYICPEIAYLSIRPGDSLMEH